MTSRMQKAIYILKAVGFVLGMFVQVASTAAHTETQRVVLASHTFNIPERYMLEEPSWWLRFLPGLDNGTREILLMIDAQEVAASVPGFKPKDGDYKDNLQLRLVVLTGQEKHRYAAPAQFADIWDGSGSYRDRIIETESKTGFVRVYRRIEYPNSWEVFTVNPTRVPLQGDIFSFWLGHCVLAHSPLTPSGTIENCDSYTVEGDVAVHFRTTEQNLPVVPEIRSYINNLLRHWEQPASHG